MKRSAKSAPTRPPTSSWAPSPGAPIITVQSAAALIGRSEQTVNQAIPVSSTAAS